MGSRRFEPSPFPLGVPPVKRFLPLGALATILSFTGCGGAHSLPPAQPSAPSAADRVVLDTIGGSPPLRLQLRLYDAPLPEGRNAQVNLALLGADAVAGGVATRLVAYQQPQMVDLLTLQQIPLALAGTVPAGHYDAVRLLVDPTRSNVVIAGRVYPMVFEQQMWHRRGAAPLSLDAAVALSGASGADLDVSVDFNVFDSVAIRGGRAYVRPKLVAAENAAQVNGRVVDSHGVPVDDATIVASDASGRVINTTLTAADGSFTLHALSAGSYRIVVRNSYLTDSGDAVVASGATARLGGPSVDVVLPPSGVLDVGTLID